MVKTGKEAFCEFNKTKEYYVLVWAQFFKRSFLEDTFSLCYLSYQHIEIVVFFLNKNSQMKRIGHQVLWAQFFKRSFLEEHKIFFYEGIEYEDQLFTFQVLYPLIIFFSDSVQTLYFLLNLFLYDSSSWSV